RLENKGVIEGYTLRLKRDVEGVRIRAHLLLQIEPRLTAEIVDELGRFQAIRTLEAVSGIFDLMALLESSDTESLDKVVDQIGAVSGVKKTQTLIVFSTKFSR
ncbi:MAG TPA: AsnC family transcriptional regulator, partial [Spongiibacteraceae bacterium]|nr:AsnC family transcriptional regulator [Spongiibacteraceae bacterium]